MTSKLISISIQPQSNNYSGRLLTDVELLLFNSTNQLLESQTNTFEAEVLPGLYRVRARAFGRSLDKLIEVNEEKKSFSIDVPIRTTSLPDGCSIGSHEYYSEAFLNSRQKLSSQTNDVVEEGTQCLYLFVRTPDLNYSKKYLNDKSHNLLAGCWLENDKEQRVINFDDQAIQSMDIGVTWFRMPIKPGFYRFFNKDEQNNISWMPIHIYQPARNSNGKIFHTEITLLWRNGLLMETAVMTTPDVHLSDHDYFLQREQTDAYIQSLAAGESSEVILSELEIGQTEKLLNPLLGIITCHLMLMQKSPNIDNIKSVLDNISKLVSYSPDLDVLHYLVSKYEGSSDPLPNLTAIPLVNNGFQKLAMQLLGGKANSIASSFIKGKTFLTMLSHGFQKLAVLLFGGKIMNELDAQMTDYMLFRDLRSPWIKTRPHPRSLFKKPAKQLSLKAFNYAMSLLGLQKTFYDQVISPDIPKWLVDVIFSQLEYLQSHEASDINARFVELADLYDLPEFFFSYTYDKLKLNDTQVIHLK